MKKRSVKSLDEMNELAKSFAQQLKGGEVLALTGELGAGKTAFTKGLLSALGVKSVVPSPTFLLMKTYPIGKNKNKVKSVCHVDAYRIKNPHELLSVGLGEFFDDETNVTVIEWADMAKALIPARAIWINFIHGKKENERIVEYANA
jgi:tRNA threonylcarbamoyladenosine biosynthesis protein TsaE